jgi:hypothetical protein
MVSIGGGYKWWSSVANHQRLQYLNGVHQTFEEPVLGVDGVADGVRAVHVVIGGVIDADVTQLVTQVVTHCLLSWQHFDVNIWFSFCGPFIYNVQKLIFHTKYTFIELNSVLIVIKTKIIDLFDHYYSLAMDTNSFCSKK